MAKKHAISKMFDGVKSPKGSAGYDNARENIDPRIVTKAVLTKEANIQKILADLNINSKNLTNIGQAQWTATEYISSDVANELSFHVADADVGYKFYSGANEFLSIRRESAGRPDRVFIDSQALVVHHKHLGTTLIRFSGSALYLDANTNKPTGYFRFNDNVPLYIGSAGDGHIYYDATNLIIDPDRIGTGKLLIGVTGDDDLIAGNIGIGTSLPLSPLHLDFATDENLRFQNIDSKPTIFSINRANAAFKELVLRASQLEFQIGTTTKMTLDASGNLTLVGAFNSGTATISASSDATDVSGINTLWVDTSGGNVVIGAFVGGVDGQELRIVVKDPSNNVTLEHNEGTGNQNIFLHNPLGDETIDAHYGGWNLVCDGSNWYDESHAKHV